MSSDTMKLQLIEKLLTVSDQAVLAAALTTEKPVIHKKSFKAFAGKIDTEQLAEMEHIIEQGCEQINADDWK